MLDSEYQRAPGTLPVSATPRTTILALIPDLFFWSKVAAAASRLGLDARQVTSVAALLAGVEAGAGLVLIDLDAQGVDALGAIRDVRRRAGASAPQLVAFASHVHGSLLERARDAGCSRVLTRGAMASGLPQLLTTAQGAVRLPRD